MRSSKGFGSAGEREKTNILWSYKKDGDWEADEQNFHKTIPREVEFIISLASGNIPVIKENEYENRRYVWDIVDLEEDCKYKGYCHERDKIFAKEWLSRSRRLKEWKAIVST